MGGLTIVVVTTVLTVITIITVSIMCQYNKYNHQCDSDLLFWCHTDWQCQYGMKDSKGNNVGVEGAIPMNCYLKGMYGKIDPNDEVCSKYIDEGYNRPQQKCSADGVVTNGVPAICSKDAGKSIDPMGIWPCSCADMQSGDYAENALKNGFTKQQSGSGSANFNVEGGVKSCTSGSDSDCINYIDVVCKMVGHQIANINTNDGLCGESYSTNSNYN